MELGLGEEVGLALGLGLGLEFGLGLGLTTSKLGLEYRLTLEGCS
jgi:hypothetical protein